jgi:hypothetical protein
MEPQYRPFPLYQVRHDNLRLFIGKQHESRRDTFDIGVTGLIRQIMPGGCRTVGADLARNSAMFIGRAWVGVGRGGSQHRVDHQKYGAPDRQPGLCCIPRAHQLIPFSRCNSRT